MNRILVIAAHPDDEILGVGGTIKKYVDRGDIADCLILGEGLTSRTGQQEISESDLKDLYHDTMEAAEIVGYRNVYFARFPDNRFDAVDLLDIIKEIEKYVQKIKPEIIYTHHHGDLNLDHCRTFQAVITACRPMGDYSVKRIYAFETPSSTEWNFAYGDKVFKPNVFIDIEETIEDKLNAMACYQTEIREHPHPRSLKALKIIASRWGSVIGRSYAEAFELIREIKD